MTNHKMGLRNRQVVAYYSEEEYTRLQLLFARTNSPYLATYVRQVSLEQPLEVKIRNASLDDLIDEIVRLRREMRTLTRLPQLSPAAQTELVEIHRSIQRAIEKIVLPCMPS